MGRWRPPAPKSSAYITPEGYETLKAELHQLWKVDRPKVTAAVQAAAANGDRSENGDYIYGKKRLREIDRRVRYLNNRINDLKVISQLPDNPNKIYFGAIISLENEHGEKVIYQIVGPDEFNLKQGKISVDSPMAKALLGKKVEDIIVVSTGEETHEYEILTIKYNQQSYSIT